MCAFDSSFTDLQRSVVVFTFFDLLLEETLMLILSSNTLQNRYKLYVTLFDLSCFGLCHRSS
jgi:hypothetical protein